MVSLYRLCYVTNYNDIVNSESDVNPTSYALNLSLKCLIQFGCVSDSPPRYINMYSSALVMRDFKSPLNKETNYWITIHLIYADLTHFSHLLGPTSFVIQSPLLFYLEQKDLNILFWTSNCGPSLSTQLFNVCLKRLTQTNYDLKIHLHSSKSWYIIVQSWTPFFLLGEMGYM